MDTTPSTVIATQSPMWRRPAVLAGMVLGAAVVGALGATWVASASSRADEAVARPLAVTAPAAAPQKAAAPAHRAAAACTDCATVEAVAAVTRKGSASGVGAVAGSLLGGVVGHQLGGGSGKGAMTVIGAVGGGVVGNEIERRRNTTTDYRLTLRMADGSTRTVVQHEALAVGSQVRVDGQRVVPAAQG